MNEAMTQISKNEVVRKLEDETEELRDKVTEIVLMLARRRHEIYDWLTRVRKERPTVGIGAIGAFCVAGGIALFLALRPQRKARRVRRSRTSQNSARSRR
ncbi:MAG TPA: hypothetical protein VK550_02610 [Polyangiaceae bacterium]|jgi:formiminotetrahydrofolate cyclodeaminase|nr:hypothetical protein [Polyangiaceae bacterium]